MGFTALFAVFASAAGVIIGMKPDIDIDCKHKGQYQAAYNYCAKGNISGIPKEFIGKECDKSMVKTLKIQVDVCN